MKNSSKSPVTFRPPAVTKNQMQALEEKWGENRSQVIIRCIDRVWCLVIGEQNSEEQVDAEDENQDKRK
jgi:hypothetical protein